MHDHLSVGMTLGTIYSIEIFMFNSCVHSSDGWFFVYLCKFKPKINRPTRPSFGQVIEYTEGAQTCVVGGMKSMTNNWLHDYSYR